MDISEEQVRSLARSQECADEVSELEQSMFEDLDRELQDQNRALFSKIQERQHEAFGKLVSLMRFSKDERLQSSIAMDMLDRGGHAAAKNVQVKHQVSIDPITAKLLKQTFDESLKGTEVIDI